MNEHTVPGPDDIRDALADSRIEDLRGRRWIRRYAP